MILIIVISLLTATQSTCKSLSDTPETLASVEELLREFASSRSHLSQISSEKQNEHQENLGILISYAMKALNRKMPDNIQLKNLVDSLGIQQDFVKPLETMVKWASELDFKVPSSFSNHKYGNLSEVVSQLTSDNAVNSIQQSLENLLDLPSGVFEFFASEKLEAIKKITANEIELDSETQPNKADVTIESISMSVSNIWMVIKSIWEKILSHVKEENSLKSFMEFTVVKVIDHILSLGDEVNLMNFLAHKLDPTLAEFVATTINPYLGPLRDFESFYTFLKENGLNGILDYFGTKRFQYTFNTITKVASAYLEGTVTDGIVTQYIDFISFNNTELHNFYESVLKNLQKNPNKNDTTDGANPRLKRGILEDIASVYTYNDNSDTSSPDHQNSPYTFDHESHGTSHYSQEDHNYPTSRSSHEARGSNSSPEGDNNGSTGFYYLSDSSTNEGNTTTDNDHLSPDSRQLPIPRYGVAPNFVSARDGYGYGGGHGGYGGGGHGGGYGGGGYGGGHGMTMDPYLILGSLILGSLLGFLLFRALRATGGGRRDINDGALSLWDSDVPANLFWGSTNADRMKRSALQPNASTEEPNVPASLRGDIWSTDPLIGEGLLDDLDENDPADHLNQLWEIYQETNETACVQSHLCGYVAQSTAEHLTSKDSSVALLMASLSNMLGVTGSGQLVDEVTQTLVVRGSYSCPNINRCHLSL